MGRLALQDIHLQLEYSMRRVNPATTKFDVAVEVVEVARFHAHEVSIVIVYNLALAYIVLRSIGMGEACSCCGRIFSFSFGGRVHVPHTVGGGRTGLLA